MQMMEAVKAVFRSWNNARAITYRRLNDIPSSWGTAVNVQVMVYGNRGETSKSGNPYSFGKSVQIPVLFGVGRKRG